MATITKAQLRNRILQHLGVLAAGEDANAEDADLVDEAIDASHAMLRSIGLAQFETSAVPEYAQLPLRDYVAAHIGPSFGLDAQRRAELAAGGAMARAALSAQTRTATVTEPVRSKAY